MTSPVKPWLEADGRLLRLRLSRPKANLIDAAMIDALDGVWDEIAEEGVVDVKPSSTTLDAEGR